MIPRLGVRHEDSVPSVAMTCVKELPVPCMAVTPLRVFAGMMASSATVTSAVVGRVAGGDCAKVRPAVVGVFGRVVGLDMEGLSAGGISGPPIDHAIAFDAAELVACSNHRATEARRPAHHAAVLQA